MPEEGRQLAVKMTRLTIRMTQPDTDKREKLGNVYVSDAILLIVGKHQVSAASKLRIG